MAGARVSGEKRGDELRDICLGNAQQPAEADSSPPPLFLSQAVGREQDAIDTCKALEATHPVRKVKKQAADLRYIFEAPKLEISDDELIKIPIIQSENWRKE